MMRNKKEMYICSFEMSNYFLQYKLYLTIFKLFNIYEEEM